MEMEYKDPSRKGRWVVLLGIVLAIAAGGSAFWLISTAQSGPATVAKTVKAYVAIVGIKPNVTITEKDVAVADVLSSTVQDPLLITDPTKILGQKLAIEVVAGQPVLSSMLLTTIPGAAFAILDPLETVGPDSEAWRAISISVSDDRAVGGVLGPRMFVDVFLTATVLPPYVPPTPSPDPSSDATPKPTPTPPAWYVAERSTKITYQKILILARTGTYYILKVPLRVAEEMVHLQSDGSVQFSLALRPVQDERILDVSLLGESTNRIIERYGLIYPELFPQPNGEERTNPPMPELTAPPSPTASPAPSASAGASAAPSASAGQ